mgnify:CR=1 FL=1
MFSIEKSSTDPCSRGSIVDRRHAADGRVVAARGGAEELRQELLLRRTRAADHETALTESSREQLRQRSSGRSK